ncbi:hypothetical protein FAES_0385 [Fibrella aestuarina BUZ 2]|uniref:Chemotaxis methyl-accepting receptor HlyB-like 4HB MCP domain-containing protein n=1 Tax=Fibrella aestuarina BUZ 2 TaxID=1166018 RepID=I0K2P4_9BACT|nr:MCP four helix bundle domain-containing protein [Fibrella aestuarina]CCG98397.1 hypothetical protein FAES_0385 [Fibrella aestuarina BUZ 2]
MTQPADKRSPIQHILLIVSLLGLILTSIFLSRRSVHDVQEASASIYKDRLVPTGMLVNLTSTIYRKRSLLETYVLAVDKPTMNQLVSSLDQLTRRTDSLLVEFSQTRLTANEAAQLDLLKKRLAVYNQLEGELTANPVNSSTAQQTLFTGRSNQAFSQVAQTLDDLASLQLTVGEELLGESRGETNYIYVLTALQIGLVLLIGLSVFWHRF